MTKLFSLIFCVLTISACGKGKTADELCEAQCDLTQDWVDDCADEFAEGDWEVEAAGDTCVTECVEGADDAAEADCETQWKATAECIADISADSLECEALSLVVTMLEKCSVQLSALEACDPTVSDDTGT